MASSVEMPRSDVLCSWVECFVASEVLSTTTSERNMETVPAILITDSFHAHIYNQRFMYYHTGSLHSNISV